MDHFSSVVDRMHTPVPASCTRNAVPTEAACWAHARRKIHDVHVAPIIQRREALKRIGELYAIEARMRLAAEQRLPNVS